MWLLSDDDMKKLLGGEFCQTVIIKQLEPNTSIRQLYFTQFDYNSYNGFRKFYSSKLKPIINSIKYLDDDNFITKVIKFVCDKLIKIC